MIWTSAIKELISSSQDLKYHFIIISKTSLNENPGERKYSKHTVNAKFYSESVTLYLVKHQVNTVPSVFKHQENVALSLH